MMAFFNMKVGITTWTWRNWDGNFCCFLFVQLMVYQKLKQPLGMFFFWYFQASFQQIKVLGTLPFQGHHLYRRRRKLHANSCPASSSLRGAGQGGEKLNVS